MVLRSHVQESRSSTKKPEPDTQPEVVSRPEVEITAETTAPIHVGSKFGAARSDSVAVAMPVDKPEAVPSFVLPARQETHPEQPVKTPNPLHLKLQLEDE